MKDLILINNSLLNDFWTEAIETVNYFRNMLSTRSKNHGKAISKKSVIEQYQTF